MSFLLRLLLVLAWVPAALPAAAGSQSSAPTITVFAAASLKESVDEISAAWLRRAGQKVVVSYGASSALARQIEQDAPADVFISADHEWMDYLQQRNRIDPRTRFDLVGNRLVLVAPAGSATRAVRIGTRSAVARALGNGRLAVAETSSVPAGRYARQSLTALGEWDALSGRLAQGDNVRAAMAFVARGEAPLGIVYATDAKAEPRVRIVAVFPPTSHEPIIYPAARVSRSSAAASQAFLAFLRGGEARRIFSAAGFNQP